MLDQIDTQKALSDIQALKQAILHTRNRLPLTVDSVDMHMVLNLAAIAIAASVFVGHYFCGDITQYLIFAGETPETRVLGVGFIGVSLLALLGVVYGYIFVRARKENRTLNDYTETHFSYFKNMSALSDIFVKFVMLALLIISSKAMWIAPLFVLFLGDIVLQGRVLILSTKESLTLGLGCLVGAVAMFVYAATSVLIPATIALIVGGWSLANIVSFKRNLAAGE